MLVLGLALLLLALYGMAKDWNTTPSQIASIDSLRNTQTSSLVADHPDTTGLAGSDSTAISPGWKKSSGVPSAVPMEDFSTGSGGLEALYTALRSGEATRDKVRIAYFGDSIIEGDLFTQDLRVMLQAGFGGNGVGYVPMSSPVAGFRMSVRQSGENWKTITLAKPPTSVPVGFAGLVFLPVSSIQLLPETGNIDWNRSTLATVIFKGSTVFSHYASFRSVTLIYSNGAGSGLQYRLNDGTHTQVALEGNDVRTVTLSNDSALTKAEMDFAATNSLKVYGAMLDDGPGVYVDNFALRGFAGTGLTALDQPIAKEMASKFNYKLVVLQFGANVQTSGMDSYEWYAIGMGKAIAACRSVFPTAGILIVSTADKGTKAGEKFVTDPGVPKLVAAQRRCAQRNDAAFWNLFAAMGGENTMVEWANMNPPLAAKDFIHFSSGGARKVARLFHESLINAYHKRIPS